MMSAQGVRHLIEKMEEEGGEAGECGVTLIFCQVVADGLLPL